MKNPFADAGLPMPKGVKVSWTTDNGTDLGFGLPPTTGHGITIADEDGGHVLVAVHSMGAMHRVIWCNVTWLTVEEIPKP